MIPHDPHTHFVNYISPGLTASPNQIPLVCLTLPYYSIYILLITPLAGFSAWVLQKKPLTSWYQLYTTGTEGALLKISVDSYAYKPIYLTPDLAGLG